MVLIKDNKWKNVLQPSYVWDAGLLLL